MPSPNQITVSQLSRLIGTPDCPTIIDVCIDEDFALDPRLIPTAFRHPHTKIEELVPNLTDQRIVVVCQKGKKLSAGASALLRSSGIAAEFLEGGNIAWRDAGEPLIPAEKIPSSGTGKGSLWVTRHRPKIDRVACPWLIKRFVDRGARFLYVPPAEVTEVAEKFDAIPFDVDGVFWTHVGNQCTFDKMVQEFDLSGDALNTMATVIRAADTNRHDSAPQAAGLLAISLGLSRMHRDDLEQLDAGMLLYDALFRWARNARNETHECPTNQARAQ